MRPTSRHIIMKMLKVKERFFLRQQEKNNLLMYKGILVRVIAVFSAENTAGQNGVAQYTQNDKKKKYLYPARLSIQN